MEGSTYSCGQVVVIPTNTAATGSDNIRRYGYMLHTGERFIMYALICSEKKSVIYLHFQPYIDINMAHVAIISPNGSNVSPT